MKASGGNLLDCAAYVDIPGCSRRFVVTDRVLVAVSKLAGNIAPPAANGAVAEECAGVYPPSADLTHENGSRIGACFSFRVCCGVGARIRSRVKASVRARITAAVGRGIVSSATASAAPCIGTAATRRAPRQRRASGWTPQPSTPRPSPGRPKQYFRGDCKSVVTSEIQAFPLFSQHGARRSAVACQRRFRGGALMSGWLSTRSRSHAGLASEGGARCKTPLTRCCDPL